MSPLNALIAGLLQGSLEWLPLSSEGLISLILTTLGIGNVEALNLSILLHLGTSFASLLYFRNDLYEDLIKEKALVRLLIIATLLTLLVASPLYKAATVVASLGPIFQLLIGFSLISTGLLMRMTRKRGDRRVISSWEAVTIGLVQGVAIIPGVSRTGLTLSYLLLRGVDPPHAFRLSYMLGIPLGFAAPIGLLLIGKAPLFPPFTLFALASTLLSALFTIHLLLRVVRGRRLWFLCFLLGCVTILITAIGVMEIAFSLGE